MQTVNLPKRPELLAQHSHIPRQTNRLTASNIAVPRRRAIKPYLNKGSNQPNTQTVIHQYATHAHRCIFVWRSHLASLYEYVHLIACSNDITRRHQLTNQLTSCNRCVLKKLTVAKLIKNFFAFCGTQRFMAVITKVCHWTLS
jgi:hypothetical protein